MDALFEKLDRLSSPVGTLLDKALARLAPQTTAAAACYSNVRCTQHWYCGSRCSTNPLLYLYYQGYAQKPEYCSDLSKVCYLNLGCQC